jgi:phospholipid/cholesterol/gamma-HCH transport system substrate-binding protein
MMETRANYALIGLFTIAVFAAALSFVYWFAGSRSNGQKTSYRVVFTGSVSGLSRGSVVRFNGLRVGEVMAIDLVPNDPSRVMAIIEVDQRTPVKADTRARLEYQGLTGQASVQLSGGTASAPALTAADGGRAVIFADRSDFQDLLETAQRISGRVDTVLTRIEKVVVDNEGSISNTIRSVETFAKALADNSAGIGAFMANAGEVSQRIASLSVRLETLSSAAEDLIRGVDARTVNRAIANVESFTQALADNRRNIDGILGDGAILARRLTESTARLDSALGEIERIARAIDGDKVGRTVDNIDRFAQAIGGGTAAIDKAIRDIASITDTLRIAAPKVDQVLTAASNFLGANQVEGRGAFSEIGETAKSFRVLADNLNTRVADFIQMAKAIETLAKNLDTRTRDISVGINRLTNSGSRDFEALATDARRAVNELNRATRNIARDPSQLITGGRPPIPEYSGQR